MPHLRLRGRRVSPRAAALPAPVKRMHHTLNTRQIPTRFLGPREACRGAIGELRAHPRLPQGSLASAGRREPAHPRVTHGVGQFINRDQLIRSLPPHPHAVQGATAPPSAANISLLSSTPRPSRMCMSSPAVGLSIMMNRIGMAMRVDGRGHDPRAAMYLRASPRACSRRDRPRQHAWRGRLAEGGSSPTMLPGHSINLTRMIKTDQWPSPQIQDAASPVSDRRRARLRRAAPSLAAPCPAMSRSFVTLSFTSAQSSPMASSLVQDSCPIVRELCKRTVRKLSRVHLGGV